MAKTVAGGVDLSALEAFLGTRARLDELRRPKASACLRAASLGPELFDPARKTSSFRRLAGIRPASELMPELGAAIDRPLELGFDFGHCSHTELKRALAGVHSS